MNSASGIFSMIHSAPKPHKQQGVALVVSLVFLLLLTIIGLATMRSTTLQESMANNVQDRMMAFEAAEASLRAGERSVSSSSISHLWDLNEVDWVEKTSTWWKGNTTEYTGFTSANNNANGANQNAPDLALSPRFAIEYQGYARSGGTNANADQNTRRRYVYRITAHSVGMTSTTDVTLQSTFATYSR